MIESLDLLAEDKVLKKRWSSLPRGETLLVFDGIAGISGEVRISVVEIVVLEEFLRRLRSLSRATFRVIMALLEVP